MVKLRLRRRGRKRLPIYDIVAADSRSPRDGRIIEKIGQYNPLISAGATMLDRERAAYWLRTGAQPTDTVRNILSREGLMLGLHMERKGAEAGEIAEAGEAHALRHKSSEAVAAKAKAAAAPVVEEEVVEEQTGAVEAADAVAETVAAEEETPATETPATEEATGETAAAEAPAAEVATEEAPAAEEGASDEEKSAE